MKMHAAEDPLFMLLLNSYPHRYE